MFDNIAARIASGDLVDFGFYLLFTGGPFCVLVVTAFRYMIKARTLEDIPTSKARSAEQGYVELEGHAEMLDGPVIKSPLSGRECVWWSYKIEKRSGNDWRTVNKETSDSLFGLRDATGQCLVDPEGAEVYPEHSRTWGKKDSTHLQVSGLDASNGDYRYKEYYLFPHEEICVIGQYRTHTAIDHWDNAEELRQLLVAWKSNQPELLARFDRNDDGVIDQHEWEQARTAARQAVLADHHELSVLAGVNVIGAPNDKRPFLMAPLNNSDFARKLRFKAILSGIGMTISGIALIFVLVSRLQA